MTADDCPACSGRWPRADHRIAELGRSLAYLHEDQSFPGWTLLVLKRHATELFDPTREERLPGDPDPRAPAWLVEHTPRPLGPDELSERIRLIRARLR